jgi:hypothetical protein
MKNQEQELLEGYRKLRPESKRLIMATVITAVSAESAVKRQNELLPEDNSVQVMASEQEKPFW